MTTELLPTSQWRGQDDDASDESRPESPEFLSPWYSRWTYWYLNPLLKLGYERPLQAEDLWAPCEMDTSAVVGAKFKRIWSEELAEHGRQDASILRAFNNAFGRYFWMAAFWKLGNDLIQFVQPKMIGLMTAYLDDHSEPIWKGLLYCLVLFVAPLCQSVCIHRYFQRCYRVGMHLRAAVTTVVYEKSLRLSNESKQAATAGEITNLMSTDARKLLDVTTYLQTLWSGPLQICISMVLLYQLLGPSALVGLAVMLLMIPINAFVARFQSRFQTQLMSVKDERVRMMNETLGGIRVIKFFAWEDSFRQRIEAIREREMGALSRVRYLDALSTFFWVTTPILVSLASFSSFVLLGNELTNEIIFPSIALFNILRFPVAMLPRVITNVVGARVSWLRIERFLGMSELESLSDSNYERSHDAVVSLRDDDDTPVIEFDHASFRWSVPPDGKEDAGYDDKEDAGYDDKEDAGYDDKEDAGYDDDGVDDAPIAMSSSAAAAADTLCDITLAVRPGQLVVVVGEVGAGKSSLLAAALGDMDRSEGRVSVRGSIAYVAQTAWIKNETLQTNVLFGSTYDAAHYADTVRVCALGPDIEMLPGGNQCEIGEKGINLSGGQKQRIAIARAVYSDADVYLFDDPLSAVDIHVGKHIYEHCILGALAGKTRVLVTHQLYTLQRADVIVCMRDGRISETGTYAELIEAGLDFFSLIDEHGDVDVDEQQQQQHDDGGADGLATSSIDAKKVDDDDNDNDGNGGDDGDDPFADEKKRKQAAQDEEDGQLIGKEERDVGDVDRRVYWAYVRSMGVLVALLIVLFPALTQSFSIGSNYWLKYWAEQLDVPDAGADEEQAYALNGHTQNWFLTFYAAISLMAGVSTFAGAALLAFGGVRAAGRIHRATLRCVFGTPVSFFDTTPIGRILNRFSKDQDAIDSQLPSVLSSLMGCLMGVTGTIVLILVASPFFLLAVVPLGVLYVYVSKYYLRSSRELKRIDSITNSPIYSHFSETLNGVTTIRAYRAEERFRAENEARLDHNLAVYFPSASINRWLGQRLEFIGTVTLALTALFAVLTRSWIDPGMIALALTYALSVTGALSWLVRMSVEAVVALNAVERMRHYQVLEQEAPRRLDSDPGATWPRDGRIEFRKVVLRYRDDLPPVLRSLSAIVYPGENIGVVGRTGAGKSSLIMALFRIVELHSGSILIDNVDIAGIGLARLREAMSIIPQDPVLFSGTIRSNIDPIGAARDHELWDALDRVSLRSTIAKLQGGLNAPVVEDGANFSVGQRQLLCLARALLRNAGNSGSGAGIVVLDEATSGVDVETDALIQTTIREQCVDSTVITIAHRINTIIDYDRIMVLDAGQLVEFDTPIALLDDPNSLFSGMVGNSKKLRKMAHASASASSSSRSSSALSSRSSSPIIDLAPPTSTPGNNFIVPSLDNIAALTSSDDDDEASLLAHIK
jgi:ATP-binding cassette, subfamily C (CFTR/MRP), member 1